MDLTQSRTPAWFFIAAGLGLAWSVFGIYQYLNTVGGSLADFEAAGMSAEQAAIMAAVPAWMDAAFAFGVFGGTLGCIGLLMRAGWARIALLVSLAGYVALWLGDLFKGVFATLGAAQVIVLTVVVAVAAALVWLDSAGRTRGIIG